MNKETYIKMTAPFRKNTKAARILELINHICTYSVFIAYPVILIYMLFAKDPSLVWLITVPLDGFIAVSVFRYIINRPRPYEKFNLPPVISKDTSGKSFPSRHVFSAFIIAFTVLIYAPFSSLLWFIGIVMVLLAIVIAFVRVISGVHYISDVIGALIFALAEAAIVLYMI